MIRAATAADIDAIARMRNVLWPEGSVDEHCGELQAFFDGTHGYPLAEITFVAEEDGRLIAFADASLRSRADGCETSPVGYLEGWFVEEQHRRRGIGAALVRAVEDWARAQGCTEMASDTWLDNETSQHAHAALGFEETDRVVNYRKRL